MKTCNHGLNLSQAQHVFLLEPSLQPALEEQAIARVRRLDQPHPTYVHRYVVQNSIEASIHHMLSGHDELTRRQIYSLFLD